MISSGSAKPVPRQGKFLFVNHDLSSRDTVAHRHAIFSHVQNQRFRKRLKDEQAPQLANGTQVEQATGQPNTEEETSNAPEAEIVLLKQAKKASSAIIPYNGSSDPFNALAIPVGAETNEVMTFGRDYLVPALFGGSTKENLLSARNWQENVAQLKDQGSAFGLMSYYCTAMSIVTKTSSSEKLALTYHMKCTSLLRERLTHADISEYPQIIPQILRLFSTEILKGHLAAAKMHSKILRRLFEISAEHKLVNPAILSYALYQDAHLSAMFMTRPSFEVEHWVPTTLGPYWKMITAQYPYLCEPPAKLQDPSLTRLEGFTQLVDNVRNLFYAWTAMKRRYPLDSDIPAIIMLWTVPWSTIHQCRLINHYLDITEKPDKTLPLEDLWPQAYISLSALYLLRSFRYDPMVAGVLLWDTTTLLLEHLQNVIVQAEKVSTLESRRRYQNALLYALFVGASAERTPSWRPTVRDVRFAWFHVRFKAHALSIGLRKWGDVEVILLGFPYTPTMKPSGADWVGEHLRVAYEKDGKVRIDEAVFRWWNDETGGFD